MKAATLACVLLTVALAATGAWADASIAGVVTFALAQQMWRHRWTPVS